MVTCFDLKTVDVISAYRNSLALSVFSAMLFLAIGVLNLDSGFLILMGLNVVICIHRYKKTRLGQLPRSERKSALAAYQYPGWIWIILLMPAFAIGIIAFNSGKGFSQSLFIGNGIFFLMATFATLLYIQKLTRAEADQA